MAKVKRQPRPKAETPKGFSDTFGGDVIARQEMLATIARVYHAHGFDPLDTSAVETVEALGKFLPDVDRPNDGVFAWQEDGDGDWLALRYDLTAPLARVYAQHRNDLPTPYRRYAMGPVWRNEKPGPGRFRQFFQCDADTVGTASVAADAEMCMMLADSLEAVGIERGDYVVRVNNRKVLNGVLETMGLGDDQNLRDAVLRTIDKFDKVGEAGVIELLGTGRKDDSGAFIDGVGLTNHQIQVCINYLGAKKKLASLANYASDKIEGAKLGDRDKVNQIIVEQLAGLVGASIVGLEGIEELRQVAAFCTTQGYGPDRIVIDPSVVRGLGYYTGPVYEAELTFEVLDDKGRARQFGSVAGGGRYDDLVKRFTGQAVPATGVSIGVDRLLAALRAKGRLASVERGPVVVTVMDRDRMAEYQTMAADLRAGGIRAEVYLGNPKNFGNQLKYADRRASPVAVIQGSDEAARGVVQIKDLILGAKIAESASLEEWKSQPAQVEVSRGDLVTEVRAFLARHGSN